MEELVANSYDADATTALILLDPERNELHIIDDGSGFSRNATKSAGILGGGDKWDINACLYATLFRDWILVERPSWWTASRG